MICTGTFKTEKKNPNLKYEGVITGDGTLSAYTGDLPASEKLLKAKATDLKLNIEDLALKTSFLPELSGTGAIEVHANPINLGENSIHFPKLDVALDLDVGKYGDVKTHASFKNLEYNLYPSQSWKGQLEWTMDQTSPFVEALEDRKQLSGILGTVAKVKNFI